MRKRRSVRRLFKRTVIVLTACWASGLIVFFLNPNKSSAKLDEFYDWLASRKPVPVKPRPFICSEYQTHAWQMVDSVEQYWAHSYAHGIKPLKRERDVRLAVDSGKLIPVSPTDHYVLDTMQYSFPFALPETKAFIDTIAVRFQGKLINTGLAGSRLIVTSLLRTESSVERLMRHNRNAIRNSAHLHGTTFDLSYARYDFERPLSPEEADYLKEVLALTLFELRREKKCWVTYELFQTCFHVVKR